LTYTNTLPIEPSESVSFTISLDPLTTGNKSASVSIKNSADPGEYSFSIAGSGDTYQTKLTELKTFFSPTPEDEFFGCVCLSGNIAMVGAPMNSDKANQAGVVYLYEKLADDDWQYVSKIYSPEPAAGDGFGSDIAIQGDTAMIGAWRDTHSTLYQAGSVYVFKYGGSKWEYDSVLRPGDAAEKDTFGVSVAIQDDYALIGALRDDGAATDGGSVYIYQEQGNGNWVHVNEFFDPGAGQNDQFGADIGYEDDLIVVGSWQDTVDGKSGAGSASVFQQDGNSVQYVTKLKAGDGMDGDAFGEAVALKNNVLLIGAHWDDEGTKNHVGSVYLFKFDDQGKWSEKTKIMASDGVAWDEFGVRLSIFDDLVFVGAFKDNYGTFNNAGSVYIYKISNSMN